MRNNRHVEFVHSLGHAVHGPAEKFFYSFLQSRGIGFVPAERLFDEDYSGKHVYTVAPWEFHLPGTGLICPTSCSRPRARAEAASCT